MKFLQISPLSNMKKNKLPQIKEYFRSRCLFSSVMCPPAHAFFQMTSILENTANSLPTYYLTLIRKRFLSYGTGVLIADFYVTLRSQGRRCGSLQAEKGLRQRNSWILLKTFRPVSPPHRRRASFLVRWTRNNNPLCADSCCLRTAASKNTLPCAGSMILRTVTLWIWKFWKQ